MIASLSRPASGRVATTALQKSMIRIAKNLTAVLAVALITVVMVSSNGPAANAAPVPAQPAGPFTIEVHKYEQPATPGDPATGLPLDAAVLPATDPVPGATFTATRVPGIDVTTTAGQVAAAALTVEDAIARIGQAAAPQAQATTDASGDATLGPLKAGVYVTQETVTPQGFVGAAPFLVVLPLTNPETGNTWLDSVHVYPKNENVATGTELFVNDEDVWACQDPVQWRPMGAIPATGQIGSYTMQNLLDPGLKLVGKASDTTVRVAGVRLAAADFEITTATIDGREAIIVTFTAQGREKLVAAKAANPFAQVELGYRTVVRGDAPGEYTNELRLLTTTSQRKAAEPTVVTSTASVKFGALQVITMERNNPGNRISGSTVQVYRTEEDARARNNAIECGGEIEWLTDGNGEVLVSCLRLSTFENGSQLAPDSSRVRNYWAAVTKLPAGWQGSTEAFAMQNLSTETPAVAEVYLTRSNGGTSDASADAQGNGDANGSGEDPDDLPLTGGQAAGILILALVLFGGGVGLLIAGRRRTPAEEPEDELIDGADGSEGPRAE